MQKIRSYTVQLEIGTARKRYIKNIMKKEIDRQIDREIVIKTESLAKKRWLD